MDRKLTITIAGDSRQQASTLLARALNSGEYQGEYLDFVSPDLFFQNLATNAGNFSMPCKELVNWGCGNWLAG